MTVHPGPALVLLSDPRIAAIRSSDDGDPLVDARDWLRFDVRLADRAGDYGHVRRDVLRRLRQAESLLPKGFGLLIIEGYRPPSTQLALFEGYRAELALAHPDWSPERCHVEASKYVAPPEVAPHQTGGAVDLTLCDANRLELDLGTAVNASPEASHDACFTESAAIPADAQAARRELSRVMSAAGFVNYPTEWWHWSFGDRYWAHTTGRGQTRFGPTLRSPLPRPVIPRQRWWSI